MRSLLDCWLLVGSIVGSILAMGCSTAPPTLREPDTYEGCATDENWRTFDEQQNAGLVKVDDAQAVSFLPPVRDGASVPFANKPTFKWQPSPTLTGKMNGDATCTANCTLCGGMTPCTLCGEHDPPVSGDDYDLQFSIGGMVVFRVLTTLQFFTPSDAVWGSFRGKTVSLVTTRMHLKVNEVDEGPYRATKALTFSAGN